MKGAVFTMKILKYKENKLRKTAKINRLNYGNTVVIWTKTTNVSQNVLLLNFNQTRKKKKTTDIIERSALEFIIKLIVWIVLNSSDEKNCLKKIACECIKTEFSAVPSGFYNFNTHVSFEIAQLSRNRFAMYLRRSFLALVNIYCYELEYSGDICHLFCHTCVKIEWCYRQL